MTAVMSGIRILEVAEHTFVPAASAILADWGADVIKVEHVERGDAMRGLASTGVMDLGSGNVHVILEHSNRGKRSIALDLSSEEGREILYRLAASCDVFLTNKVPHVVRQLRIDVDDIRAHNEKIVYVRGTGWGARGPDADKGGYDMLGYWCRSGIAYGAKPPEREQPMAQPGPAYGDSIGAMTIAGGICAALLHRERTGDAPEVDVSLLGTGLWALGAGVALSLQLGTPCQQPPPARERPFINPLTNMYRTRDARWVMLSCLQGFKYWPEFCRTIDRPELVDDPRFASAEAFREHAVVGVEIVEAEIAKLTLSEWRDRLQHFSGQWTPVLNSLEAAEDPQVVANGYVQEVLSKDGERFRLVAAPVQFDGAPSVPHRAPDFNEHGDDILTGELGLEWEEVVQLKLDGVVA
jgi:crotonobetainyl-CoA:carnitine CoA-transferase CaiB-like acyl-CoA transferase